MAKILLDSTPQPKSSVYSSIYRVFLYHYIISVQEKGQKPFHYLKQTLLLNQGIGKQQYVLPEVCSNSAKANFKELS